MFPLLLLLAVQSNRRQWWNFLPLSLSLCPPASLIPPPPFCSLNSRFSFSPTLGSILFPLTAFIFLCYPAVLADVIPPNPCAALHHSLLHLILRLFLFLSLNNTFLEERVSDSFVSKTKKVEGMMGGWGWGVCVWWLVWTQQHKFSFKDCATQSYNFPCTKRLKMCQQWEVTSADMCFIHKYAAWESSDL